MTDKDYYYFYMDSVNASAAYLTDEDDMVIARCIIYNEVKDQDGNKWRLAERQYASDENDILKRALIDALIKGGYIDGYKKSVQAQVMQESSLTLRRIHCQTGNSE